MKSILCSLLLVCLLTVKGNAQDLTNPGTYMTAVSNAQNEMDQKYMAYMSAAAHGRRARKLEKMRKQVLESVINCKYKITDLPYYKGDNSLRQSSIDYVQLCYNVFNDDYTKIVNMEEIAEQSFDEMQAYILLQEKTSEKIKEASAKMQKASKEFAAKYNVNLIETKSELGEKMEVAGKLNHYQNQVYLIFFKCNYQDVQITDAMNKKKVNDVEQSRSALIRYANEGLLALDSLKTFQGDATLSSACKQLLQYYKKSAENDIPKQTDFYLKQENFDKIKKALEAKSANDRTKEDIDAYNKAVKEINAASNTFNNLNASMNNTRHEMLDNWEKTQKEFADTHMPRYK